MLVKIVDDDIRGWPMYRVAQRLSPFRIPEGSIFALTFARAIKARRGSARATRFGPSHAPSLTRHGAG